MDSYPKRAVSSAQRLRPTRRSSGRARNSAPLSFDVWRRAARELKHLAGNLQCFVSPDEGAKVTVVTRGADESFSLSESQENELLAFIAEIERGDYVALEELLTSLPKRGQPRALRVKISARAANEVRKAAEWWFANRPSAPDAITADFGESVGLLAEQPGIGAFSGPGKLSLDACIWCYISTLPEFAVSNMNPIIDIKATGTGWVRCTVRPARRNYVFSASYDSDALGSLVMAALSIMSDINSISFKFYGNYSDWIWMIERNAADHIEIEILEATPNLSGPLGEYDLKPVVKFSRTPIAFAQSIHITASEMLKEHGPKKYKELSVYHDFPKELVQLLGKRITARQDDA